MRDFKLVEKVGYEINEARIHMGLSRGASRQNLIDKVLTLNEPENKPFGRVFYTQEPDGHKLSFYKHVCM